ncbi:DUF6380 family protein [Streptomyces sp. NBC_01142]
MRAHTHQQAYAHPWCATVRHGAASLTATARGEVA